MEVTYKIIGADGREYGPATLDELKRWISEGRIAGGTQVWRSDSGLWASASTYVEFRGYLPNPGAVAATILESAPSFQPAGFWARLGAYLIDWILVWAVTAPMLAPFRKKFENFTPGAMPDLEDLLRILVAMLMYTTIWALVDILYTVGMNGKFGCTVGKMAIGAKIVNLDGSPMGYGRAFGRYAAGGLNWLTFLIGYFMVGFREDKRGLHDLIAKTRVIYTR